MTVILIRMLLFYVALTAIMRMMGKRQIGEMQISEFVTAFLISEMAALPITDIDIPIMHGVTAIAALACFETFTSLIARKSVTVRRMISGEPVILVADGKVIEKALTEARVSLDEVFSQIRGQGYRNIGDVQYVILEQNGKMSVLPKASFDGVTPNDLNLGVADTGMTHPVVIDGKTSKCFMGAASVTPRDVSEEARRRKADIGDILYMTVDDAGNKVTVKKESAK